VVYAVRACNLSVLKEWMCIMCGSSSSLLERLGCWCPVRDKPKAVHCVESQWTKRVTFSCASVCNAKSPDTWGISRGVSCMRNFHAHQTVRTRSFRLGRW
jgi:hypothetical protein